MAFVFPALIITAILSVISLLVYRFYKWLSKKGYSKASLIVLFFVVSFLAYNIYVAIYPEEFKNGAFHDLPRTAHFLDKKASYPDFHGSYGTSFLIEVSKKDFNDLEDQLLHDNRFKKAPLKRSVEVNDVMRYYDENNIVTGLASDGEHYCFVGFFKNRKTLIVHTESY